MAKLCDYINPVYFSLIQLYGQASLDNQEVKKEYAEVKYKYRDGKVSIDKLEECNAKLRDSNIRTRNMHYNIAKLFYCDELFESLNDNTNGWKYSAKRKDATRKFIDRLGPCLNECNKTYEKDIKWFFDKLIIPIANNTKRRDKVFDLPNGKMKSKNHFGQMILYNFLQLCLNEDQIGLNIYTADRKPKYYVQYESFAREDDFQKLYIHMEYFQDINASKDDLLSEKKYKRPESGTILNWTKDAPIIYIYKNLLNCHEESSNLVTYKAKILNLLDRGRENIILVLYSEKTGRYLISASDVEKYKMRGIVPQIKMKRLGYSSNINSLNEQSTLALYGYKVGHSGLHESTRERIITFLIENDIMKWYEISNHLQWCINMRIDRSDKDFSDAIQDWKDDIDFIQKYVREKKLPWLGIEC